MFFKRPLDLPTATTALPGRPNAIPTAQRHFVNGEALQGPYADGLEHAYFAMGCFWGVERILWQVPGVVVTAVGYQQGVTPNASYEEVCSGRTGHTESVLVVYVSKVESFAGLMKVFWEGHDPTQGMRQGNDVGTQYRSGVYVTNDEQARVAQASKAAYQIELGKRGFGPITSEIAPAETFYFAEDYHQQYLAKNPNGYCGIGGTGVTCPIGVGVTA